MLREVQSRTKQEWEVSLREIKGHTRGSKRLHNEHRGSRTQWNQTKWNSLQEDSFVDANEKMQAFNT